MLAQKACLIDHEFNPVIKPFSFGGILFLFQAYIVDDNSFIAPLNDQLIRIARSAGKKEADVVVQKNPAAVYFEYAVARHQAVFALLLKPLHKTADHGRYDALDRIKNDEQYYKAHDEIDGRPGEHNDKPFENTRFFKGVGIRIVFRPVLHDDRSAKWYGP
ncbi:hypothetical protein SDC9_199989 [bioreactor metagenome]|uniref:Uncharacterized protein n=1 Tax=bioreactor metagenome TaxID=1076179 RepID=A0A645IYP0_9ZZZZ